MTTTHLHVGQSQPHSSEAPILQFLGKPKKRRRRLENEDCLEIVDHKLKGSSHVQYKLKVRLGSQTWCFWTRYSMLLQFHSQIQADCCNNYEFPSKKVFGNLEQSFIEHRKEKLNNYLHHIFQDSNIRNGQVFQNFINESKIKGGKISDYLKVNCFRLDD